MATCLIVDDSRVIRKVARRIIEELGFICHEAEHGQHALDFCNKQLPTAILLDWIMPVMDGMQFLQALRALPNGNQPIVVLCTVNIMASHIHTALKQGANEYIMKPFDAEIIKDKFIQAGLLQAD